MKNMQRRRTLPAFIVISFILLSFIPSFADTTTYQYDDVNRKIRVESGTPGVVPTYSISGTVTSGGSGLSGVTMTLSGAGTGTSTPMPQGITFFAVWLTAPMR